MSGIKDKQPLHIHKWLYSFECDSFDKMETISKSIAWNSIENN